LGVSFEGAFGVASFGRIPFGLAVAVELALSADGVDVVVGAEVGELADDGGFKPPGSERHQMGLASVR
jgi:hypothetical protein